MHGLTSKKVWIVCFAIIMLYPLSALSQGAYPTRPITLIVSFNAGGNTDIGLRILGDLASKHLGQSIVVENKPGAGGFLGFATALNTKPDGYTIVDLCPEKYTDSLMGQAVPHNIDDATIIGLYWSVMHTIVARADAPWNSFKDMVDYARTHPGEVTFGVVTNSHSHLAMLTLGKQLNVNWKPVPYKGTAEMIPALLGGHIKLLAGFGGTNLLQAKAGKVKVLAAMGAKRLPYFPDVPTLKEMGYDVNVSFDIGLGGPKGIPSSVVQKLQDGFDRAAKEQKFQDFVKDNMMVHNYMDSKQYAQHLKERFDYYAPIIRELGLAFKKK